MGDVVTEDWRRAGFLCRRFFSLYRCASLSRSSFARRCFDLGRAREARGSKKLRRARVDLLNFLNGGGKKGARERERECIEAREKQSKKTEMQRSSPFFLPLSFVSLFLDDLGRSNGGRCRFSARSKRQQQQPLPPPARRGARGPRWSMLGYRLEPRR